MTVARSLLERRAIRDSDFWGSWGAGDDTPGRDLATGVNVSRNTTLGLSAVWSCVSLIADTVATLPAAAFDVGENGVKTRVADQPLWLETPNPEQTIVDFWFGVIASLLLDGNAFIYTIRNALQEVVEAWVLDPQWVQVRREWVTLPSGGSSLELVYYIMVAKGQQSPVGPFRVVAGPDMFHVTAFNPSSNWPRGIAPLEVARQMFGGALANQEMGARFYGQGMNASGVIEVPGDMLIDQARELKRDFANANGGLARMHLPPVLTGGATWKQIMVSPEQAQFLESRRFVVEDIARWFRVPLWMIQSNEKTTSWGSGIEQMGIGFVTYTLNPWIGKVTAGFKKHTLMPFHPARVVAFNVRSLLKGDHTARAQWYASGRQWGWLSADDIRADEDMPPLPDGKGEIYLEPVNMQEPGVSDPASMPKTGLPSVQAPATAAPDEGD